MAVSKKCSQHLQKLGKAYWEGYKPLSEYKSVQFEGEIMKLRAEGAVSSLSIARGNLLDKLNYDKDLEICFEALEHGIVGIYHDANDRQKLLELFQKYDYQIDIDDIQYVIEHHKYWKSLFGI